MNNPAGPGRCPTCGSRRSTWTRPVILQAMRDWATRNGEPPKFEQWKHATPEHPGYRTVYEMFGGWSAALQEAGLRPRRYRWDKDKVKRAVFEWVYENGRPPKSREWMPAHPDGAHPSAHTAIRLFGTWAAAMRASGYEPVRDSGVKAECRRERTAAGTFA